jgi:uncharacterized membrane protein
MHRTALAAATALLVLGGCTTTVTRERDAPRTPAPEPPSAAAPDASPIFGWRCDDGTELVTRYDDASGRLLLEAPDGVRRLERAVTASGAAWTAGETRFWNRGDEALWEQGAAETTCRVDPVRTAEARAAADGAWFRALGNEPGWSLAIHPERMVWITDWGSTRRTFATGWPETADDGAQVLAGEGEDGTLRVRIERDECVDDGDQRWPATVTLGFGDRAFRGCGRHLDD